MKIENLTSNHPDFLPRQSILVGMKNRYYLLNLVPVVNNYLKVLHTAYRYHMYKLSKPVLHVYIKYIITYCMYILNLVQGSTLPGTTAVLV